MVTASGGEVVQQLVVGFFEIVQTALEPLLACVTWDASMSAAGAGGQVGARLGE